ncbi:MAG: peptidoglycan bridge formation glycyltransferase FemA/FemB family protein [Anaerolineales bacterium]
METQITRLDWTSFIEENIDAHILQTSAWGTLKSSFGWKTRYIRMNNSGAQILFRKLPLGFTLAYIPKGPIGDWLPELLPALIQVCKEERAFMLKIEPDAAWVSGLADQLQTHGFRLSTQTIQPQRTITVDLTADEDEILGRMKQKTRYNIRLAERKGVTVQPWNNIRAFAAMTLETAERDQFGAHNQAYFQDAYDLFHPSGECELLVAEIEGEPVAAMMVFARGQRAWYFYGASLSIHREKMPTYLLQWEAMRWSKVHGCLSYDLWGIPDADEKTLEDQFTSRSDGLWGVYRFKRGFGGDIIRSMGAWDLAYNPMLFQLYQLALRLRFHG